MLLKFSKAKGAGDTDCRGSGSIGLQRMPSAVRLLQLGFARCGPRMALLVRLHAVERFFELGHQRSLARLEAVAAHDAPEIIATRSLVPVVHGHHIFGRPTRDQNDDVCFGRPVDERQFAPILNGVLHGTDRIPIFWKKVGVELVAVVGGNVDVACVRESARKCWDVCGTGFGRREGGNRQPP